MTQPDRGNELGGQIREFRRATTAGFDAPREDHIELRRHLTAGFHEVDDHLTEVDLVFAEMRARLDALLANQRQIIDKLAILISRRNGE